MNGGGAYGSRAARWTWFTLLGGKAFLERVAGTLLALGAGANPRHFMLQTEVTQSLPDIFNCGKSLSFGN